MAFGTRVYIRAARPHDREAVFRFCQHTWEWGDYIPQVWERWLVEPQGKLLVATGQGQPVAIGHVVLAAPGQAWLEGLRVDPAHRGEGLATRLTRRCVKEADALGARVVRFATSSLNTPVHRLAAQLRFSKVATFLPLQAEAEAGNGPVLSRPSTEALPYLLSGLRTSAALTAMGGLYSTGWRFHRLSPEELNRSLEQGMVRAVGAPDSTGAWAIVESGYGGEGLGVNFADGQPEALTTLALGLRREAAGHETHRVSARLPVLPALQEAFHKAGYQPVLRDPLWIYEIALERVGAAVG